MRREGGRKDGGGRKGGGDKRRRQEKRERGERNESLKGGVRKKGKKAVRKIIKGGIEEGWKERK